MSSRCCADRRLSPAVAAINPGRKPWRLALAGNPNTGKSSIFNALTGARQHVGNWPGKTVEKKAGWFTYAGQDFELFDLPGIYSLSTFSAEETIARNALLELRPDGVILVLDATNLERNLYLAVQVLEMGAPAVVALNMVDAARARGLRLDLPALAAALGAPVVPTVARRRQGISALLDAISRTFVSGLSRRQQRAAAASTCGEISCM